MLRNIPGRWSMLYGHDDLGNLTSRLSRSGTGPLPNVIYHHDQTDGAGPHALTSSTWGEYRYDKKGNQTRAPGRVVDYTEFNLPRRITQDGTVTEFSYDALGMRVRKADSAGDLVTVGGLYEKRQVLRSTPYGSARCRSIGSAGVFPGAVPSAPPGSRRREHRAAGVTAAERARAREGGAVRPAGPRLRRERRRSGADSPAGRRAVDHAVLLESGEGVA